MIFENGLIAGLIAFGGMALTFVFGYLTGWTAGDRHGWQKRDDLHHKLQKDADAEKVAEK